MISIPSGPVRYGLPRLVGAVVALGLGIRLGVLSGSVFWLPVLAAGGVIGWLLSRATVRAKDGRPTNTKLESVGALVGVTIATIAAAIGGSGPDLRF